MSRAIPALTLILTLAAFGRAHGEEIAQRVTLPPVEVIGTSPLSGSGIERAKIPANTHVFSAPDLARDGMPSLTGALMRDLSSVNVTDVQVSPFQPDIEFRGFSASSVPGTQQGLAIYQNG